MLCVSSGRRRIFTHKADDIMLMCSKSRWMRRKIKTLLLWASRKKISPRP